MQYSLWERKGTSRATVMLLSLRLELSAAPDNGAFELRREPAANAEIRFVPDYWEKETQSRPNNTQWPQLQDFLSLDPLSCQEGCMFAAEGDLAVLALSLLAKQDTCLARKTPPTPCGSVAIVSCHKNFLRDQ